MVGHTRPHGRDAKSTMTSGSDVDPVTRSRAAHTSSMWSRSRAEVQAAQSTLDKVLQDLQYKSVCKAVAEIADQDADVESLVKLAVDDALTG